MSNCSQMSLIHHDEAAGTLSSLRSEQELAGLAWAIAQAGAIAKLTDPEFAVVETALYMPHHDLDGIIASIRDGHDPLGNALVRLRSPSQRRPMGAVYTPPEIVDAMVGWIAAKEQPVRVVDPGAGSGRFIVEAGKRLPDASLVAVELDPLAALLCRANLTATGFDSRASVIVDDYREVSLDECAGATAFVGNPPYVRHHQIDSEWKGWLTAAASANGLPVSALAGLHIHFFLATLLLAKPGDIGAFITSAEWMDVNYGCLLREMLTDGLGGESIHVVAPEATPFENTAVTAAVTCFRVGSTASSLRLRRVEQVEELADLTAGHKVGKQQLKQEKRWSQLLTPVQPMPEGYIELGELCRVHRGSVTGANAIWITRADDPALPGRTLFPSITRARELFDTADGVLLNLGDLRAVIDLPEDLSELGDEDRNLVERFLRLARTNGAHSSYVARHRNPWWSVGLRSPAPILATYMARRPPAFVRNPLGARCVNVAHGIYPRQPLTGAVLDALTASLRTSVSITQGRTYAGGLTKFEPSEMERIPVPSLALLEEIAA